MILRFRLALIEANSLLYKPAKRTMASLNFRIALRYTFIFLALFAR